MSYTFLIKIFHCRLVRFLFISLFLPKPCPVCQFQPWYSFKASVIGLSLALKFIQCLHFATGYITVDIERLDTYRTKRAIFTVYFLFKKLVLHYFIYNKFAKFFRNLFLFSRFRKDKLISSNLSACKINWNVTKRVIWDSFFVALSLPVNLHSRLEIAGFISSKLTNKYGDRSQRLSSTEVLLPRKHANCFTTIKQSIS